MPRQIENLFVIGTDTGVGKTVLSLLLMQFFYSRGYSPFYLKPIQTGCKDPRDVNSDATFIYRHVQPLKGKDPAESVIYCFKNPKAPFFAARDEGREIDIRLIRRVVDERSLLHSPVILEAAGGLLVPVSEKILMVDTIRITGARPIIAARPGLGTINHTLLTIEALRRRRIRPAGIVFINSTKEDTAEDMIQENMEAIERFSGIKVGGLIGKIKDFSHPDRDCYWPLERIFGTL
ncbi:MAG: dethiobiotin synthase [Syntrophales bacterium]|nr:dethiobiotin synthase [Syntrophales bacterium]